MSFGQTAPEHGSAERWRQSGCEKAHFFFELPALNKAHSHTKRFLLPNRRSQTLFIIVWYLLHYYRLSKRRGPNALRLSLSRVQYSSQKFRAPVHCITRGSLLIMRLVCVYSVLKSICEMS